MLPYVMHTINCIDLSAVDCVSYYLSIVGPALNRKGMGVTDKRAKCKKQLFKPLKNEG